MFFCVMTTTRYNKEYFSGLSHFIKIRLSSTKPYADA